MKKIRINIVTLDNKLLHSYNSTNGLVPIIGDTVTLLEDNKLFVVNERLIPIDGDSVVLICKEGKL